MIIFLKFQPNDRTTLYIYIYQYVQLRISEHILKNKQITVLMDRDSI